MKRDNPTIYILCLILCLIVINGHSQTVDETQKAVMAFVNASSDDAEENLNDGTTNICNKNLKLTSENNHNLLGIRFSNLNIPQGAVITSARLVYKVDQLNSNWTNILISAEYTDDAETFEEVTGNISKRERTETQLNWNDRVKWTHTNGWYTSPTFTEVVQEVINRSGWEENNSLALLIEGTGSRTLVSYDGNEMTTPMLIVKYIAKENVFTQTFSETEEEEE